MKSLFTINLLLFLFVHTCFPQVAWQYSENTNGNYSANSLVYMGSNTFVAYTNTVGSSTDLNFYVLDSQGLKILDTSFSTSPYVDEQFYGIHNLNNGKVAITSCLYDSANYYAFNVVTCFDSLGNFLWRVENDSSEFGAISSGSSGDSIFFFYPKGLSNFIDTYDSSGTLVNHISSPRVSTTGNLLEFEGFLYKNGVFYIFGNEVLNGNDTQMFIRGIDLNGTIVFEGTSNPTTGYDRVTNVDIDDNFNVAYGGFADSASIFKFKLGTFNGLGNLLWQKSELYGSTYTLPEQMSINGNSIYVSTISSASYGLCRIDRYDLITGLKVNLLVMDSVATTGGIRMEILSNDKLLLGGLRGVWPYRNCRFLYLDLNTLVVDTIYESQVLPLTFPFMIPKDTSGFFYSRGLTVYYFEKTTTSISESELDNNSQLPYPNPFYDKLNLECKETDIINFYDYSGRLCLTSIKLELPNKIHELNKGNYIVEIVGGSILKKFRLVKN